ncbi:hypothetical protein Q604_UNBC03435G0001, partial [human gut metagenome]
FTHVGIADGAAHIVQRHALIKQRLRIQPDAYGGQAAAEGSFNITPFPLT